MAVDEDPPLTDDDYRERIKGDVPPPNGHDGTKMTVEWADELDEHLTETGNAKRIARDHGKDLRFVPEWQRWYVWNGSHWQVDPAEVRIQEYVERGVRGLFSMAAAAHADDRKPITKWALASESKRVRANTASLLRACGLAVPQTAFDARPMLLNVRNGTIDLATGNLRQHGRDDMLTCASDIVYDPGARCPRWQRFLVEVLPDIETASYLQRVVGYLLSGLVREHAMWVLHGAGRNGKSTLVNVLVDLLGPYAARAPSDLLLAVRNDPHPTERTILHSRRLIVASETDSGRRWAEAKLKELTGGDKITAHRMREDWWEFWPTHKFFVCTNNKPRVKETDEAIWRRLKLIPFERTFDDASDDKGLSATLKSEAPGILNWALGGCADYLRDGLREPARVTTAVAEYRSSEDLLGQFIEERCVLEKGAWIVARDLRSALATWAEAEGHALSLNPSAIGARMNSLGCFSSTERIDGKKTRTWSNVKWSS